MGGEEWGPWIEHDGKGCPVRVGTMVHRVFDCPVEFSTDRHVIGSSENISTVAHNEMQSWHSAFAGIACQVIRYRVRKPRGLIQLERIARDVEPSRTPDRERERT